MKDFFKQYKGYIAGGIVILCSGIFFAFCLMEIETITGFTGKFLRILKPVAYGAVITYLLAPICNRLEIMLRKAFGKAMKNQKLAFKFADSLSILSSIVFLFVVLILILLLIVPQTAMSIMKMAEALPKNIAHLTDMLEKNPEIYVKIEEIWQWGSGYLESFLNERILPNVTSYLQGITDGIVGAVNVLYNFLMGTVVSVYWLSNRKSFAVKMRKLFYACFSREWAERILKRIDYADEIFGGFLYGNVLDSVLVGIICFLGMKLFDMPYALLVSVIVGITNMIPFFGPYIGAVPSVIIILLESPVTALYFLLFIMVLQQIDGNIISNLIIGDKVGLSGFWVMIAILIFGGFFGIIGMLVGIPVFAVIYSILSDWVNGRLKKKEIPDNLFEKRG